MAAKRRPAGYRYIGQKMVTLKRLESNGGTVIEYGEEVVVDDFSRGRCHIKTNDGRHIRMVHPANLKLVSVG